MLTKRFVLVFLALLCTLTVLSAAADVQYIFPDSNTRKLTWEEVEAWNNEALNIGFNEIWARHGYVFKSGGACDRWFSQQEWYHPITSGTNEKNVLPKASKLEWENYHLIKDVMAYKRSYELQNEGKKLPMPPQSFDLLSGFQYVELKTEQKFPVYSAPSASSWRSANGKASVGWINLAELKGKASLPGAVRFDNIRMTLDQTVFVTDDPVGQTPMTTLNAGTQVTWLSTFYSNYHIWDYIEFNLNGQRARGFVMSGYLQTEEPINEEEQNG